MSSPRQPTEANPKRLSVPSAAQAPVIGFAVWLACAVIAATAGSGRLVAWVVLLAVPGLSLSPFLPKAAKRSAASSLVASLVAAACFWPIAIPTLDLVGFGVDSISLIGTTGLLALVCVATSFRAGATARPAGTEARDWFGLGIGLAAAGWIAIRTFHDPPLGSDWGHYWRFADAIAGSGSLDAINTGWMGGGLPFGDYPGLPALMAAWLIQAGVPASATPALAGILYCGCVASTWLAVRACWGSMPAALAGIAAALLPPAMTTIGWSGLALSLSLVFAVPLIAAVSAMQFEHGAERRRLQFVTASLATATVATQPLTAIVVGASLFAYSMICLIRTRVDGLRALAGAAAMAVPMAVPVMADYRSRLGRLGVAQDYEAFLPTRISWSETLSTGLLPALAVALAAIGLLAMLRAGKTRHLAVASLLLAVTAIAYSQSWRIEFAGEYRRAAYLLAPAIAIGIGGLAALGKSLGPASRLAAAAILVGGLAFTVRDWPERLEGYYLTATPSAARAVTEVGRLASGRGEAIATDSCWSFPALGLTRAKVFAALEPSLIGPRSELEPASLARAILAGGREGRLAADRLSVRWILLDPQCPVGDAKKEDRSSLPSEFIPVASSRTLTIGYRPSR